MKIDKNYKNLKRKENYFSCDYCHRVGTGITIVNGFKMCPMCLTEYQHKSGENNELREELGRKNKEVEQLKKENEELKELIAFRNTGRVSGKLVAEKVLRFNDLQEENTRLKAELAEKDRLLENAILPKFNKGEECYAFTDHCAYFSNDKVNILDIELKYKCKNDLEQIIYCENSLYKTFEQAEEALKKLKEKSNE